MKAVISGPRRLWREDEILAGKPWPHIHVELNLPELPAEGEHIILNDGLSYVVKRRMWWVDGPKDEGYWSLDGDYNTKDGKYKVAYIDVLPSGYDEPFTPDKMLAEGKAQGHDRASAEVEKILALADIPEVGPAGAVAMVREWAKLGALKARAREEANARHREVAERILDQLQAEREEQSHDA